MRCPCAILLILVGNFLMFQPSSQYLPGPLYTPQTVPLGHSLTISCSALQVFGTIRYKGNYMANEVALMKIRDHFYRKHYYTIRPSFIVMLRALKRSVKRYIIGNRTDKEIRVSWYRGLMRDVYIKQENTNMKCNDYGLYLCYMRLKTSYPPPKPKTILCHKIFFVDYIDNTPKLKISPKDTKFKRGTKLNFTCEQSTQERMVHLIVLYKRSRYSRYIVLTGMDYTRFTRRVENASCGGYFIYHFSLSAFMNEKLWNSKFICQASPPRIYIPEPNVGNRDVVSSSPIVLASCAGMTHGCISTSVRDFSNDRIQTVGKTSTVAYYTLLPVLLLAVVSFAALIITVLKSKHKE